MEAHSEMMRFDKREHDARHSVSECTLGHYCPDWDGVYICEQDEEFEGCRCAFWQDLHEILSNV